MISFELQIIRRDNSLTGNPILVGNPHVSSQDLGLSSQSGHADAANDIFDYARMLWRFLVQ